MNGNRGYEAGSQGSTPVEYDPTAPRYEGEAGLGGGEQAFGAPRGGEHDTLSYQVPQHDYMDTTPLDTTHQHQKEIGEQLLRDEIPKDNKKRNRVIAAVTGAAVTAAGAIAFGVLSGKDSSSASGPQSSTSTAAPANPGETSSTENSFENYTLETFPFEINGKTIRGVEGLEEEFGIDGLNNPDTTTMTKSLVDNVNKLMTFGTGEEKELYKDYVSPKDGTRGVEGVMNDFLLPSLPQVFGANPEEFVKPGSPYAGDFDNFKQPDNLYQMIKTGIIGNIRYPEDGVTKYEIASDEDIHTRDRGHDPSIIPVQAGEVDNSLSVEVDLNLVQGNVVMPIKWSFFAIRAPFGPHGEDQYRIGTFTRETR